MENIDTVYAIINIKDLDKIDFTQTQVTSKDTIRMSVDLSEFVIKWEGKEPTFIADGSVIPLKVLSHSECLELMSTDKWSEPIEEKVEDEIKRR